MIIKFIQCIMNFILTINKQEDIIHRKLNRCFREVKFRLFNVIQTILIGQSSVMIINLITM